MAVEFILKIEELCNLACDYCFMYEKADQGWRDRPRRMSDEIVLAAARGIGEYAANNALGVVRVILHGGEPLLGGPGRIGFVAQAIQDAMPPGTAARIRMQTNGTLLRPAILDVMMRFDIRAGVSLDGAPAAHDEHRRYRSGRGSYDRAAAGLALLSSERYRSLFGGILCVINPDSDPVEAYRTIAAFHPPLIDFLLPLANHVSPPAQGCGKWLIDAFDAWYAESNPPRVRIFEGVLHRLLGGTLNTSDPPPLVIESDGTIEMVDSLKAVKHGLAATGQEILTGSLTEAFAVQEALLARLGAFSLTKKCQDCEVVSMCEGGYFPHRWDGISFPAGVRLLQ